MVKLDTEFNDGGRSLTGRSPADSDSVVRAIAIATGTDYNEVYSDLEALCDIKRETAKSRTDHPETGIKRDIYGAYLETFDMLWNPTMFKGPCPTRHLRKGEVPMRGSLVAVISREAVAIVDGVVQNIYDPTRDGNRIVYGFFATSEVRDAVLAVEPYGGTHAEQDAQCTT